MIYVLLAVALFAALAFILSKQSGTAETSTLSKQQTEIYATQILQQSMQIKQAVDAMTYSGSRIDTLDFTLPGDAGYDTPPNGQKVFHPDGGGVIFSKLPDDAATPGADPAPGWYLGRFNNFAWTATAGTDVVLTAYHVAQPVCAKIDEKLTGSATIPAATSPLRILLVSASRHSGGNIDFSSSTCAACVGKPSLCIEEPTHDAWSFYSLVETR